MTHDINNIQSEISDSKIEAKGTCPQKEKIMPHRTAQVMRWRQGKREQEEERLLARGGVK